MRLAAVLARRTAAPGVHPGGRKWSPNPTALPELYAYATVVVKGLQRTGYVQQHFKAPDALDPSFMALSILARYVSVKLSWSATPRQGVAWEAEMLINVTISFQRNKATLGSQRADLYICEDACGR